jgi:hypothetical protein
MPQCVTKLAAACSTTYSKLVPVWLRSASASNYGKHNPVARSSSTHKAALVRTKHCTSDFPPVDQLRKIKKGNVIPVQAVEALRVARG